MELESLSLYADTIDTYLKILKDVNFKDVSVVDHSKKYALYNEEIVQDLRTSVKKEDFIRSFNEKIHVDAIDSYNATAKAMRSGETMVIQFTTTKAF